MQVYTQNLKMPEKEKRNSHRLSLEDKQKKMLSTGRFLVLPVTLWEVTHVETLVPRDTHSTHKYISFSNLCGSSKPGLQKVYCCLFYLSGSDFLFPDEEPSSWPSVKEVVQQN